MMKHAEKVDMLQKRLQNFSSYLMMVGLAVAGFAAFCFVTNYEVKSSNDHKLKATHEGSDQGLNQMFSGISVLIWSMIAAKAKTGMNAATNGEVKTVG